ncbi:MAG: iron-sulfur cluster assembly scaffold protein [Blastomonas sp.]
MTQSASVSALYTRPILAEAVKLARWPLDRPFSYSAELRSKTCGSLVAIGFDCDGRGYISALGLKVSACALGQASAALFAAHAMGKDRAAIETATRDYQDWLEQRRDDPPDWPGIAMLAGARDFPARHPSLLLAFRAALAAFDAAAENSRDAGACS